MKNTPDYCKRNSCSEFLEPPCLDVCSQLPAQEGLPCGHLKASYLPDYQPVSSRDMAPARTLQVKGVEIWQIRQPG